METMITVLVAFLCYIISYFVQDQYGDKIAISFNVISKQKRKMVKEIVRFISYMVSSIVFILLFL